MVDICDKRNALLSNLMKLRLTSGHEAATTMGWKIWYHSQRVVASQHRVERSELGSGLMIQIWELWLDR